MRRACLLALVGAAHALPGSKQPCTEGNSLATVTNCDGKRPACISHAWFTHDNPGGCDAAAVQEYNWPAFPLDKDPAGPASHTAIATLFRGPWANKTVIFDGDSIMEEQWASTICALRAQGLNIIEAPMCPPQKCAPAALSTFKRRCNSRSALLREALCKPKRRFSAAALTFSPFKLSLTGRSVHRCPSLSYPHAPNRVGMRADNYIANCESLDSAMPEPARAFYARVRALPDGAWSGDVSPRLAFFVPATASLVVRKGYGIFHEKDFRELLSLGDVVVSGYGLHYHEGRPAGEPDFAADIRQLVSLIPADRPRGSVLLKEVSAQHFMGDGAFEAWEQNHADRDKRQEACVCTQMNATVRVGNWVARQNAIIAEATRGGAAGGAGNVVVLPYYNATADRPDLKVRERTDTSGPESARFSLVAQPLPRLRESDSRL